MLPTLLPTISGWIGMALILGAYYLVSSKKVGGGSRAYQLMNLFGGGALAWNTLVNQAWPATTLNVVWVIVAAWALFRSFTKKQEED